MERHNDAPQQYEKGERGMKSIWQAVTEAITAWIEETIMWEETHRSFGYYGIRRKGGK